jgi:hypothetical protein
MSISTICVFKAKFFAMLFISIYEECQLSKSKVAKKQFLWIVDPYMTPNSCPPIFMGIREHLSG